MVLHNSLELFACVEIDTSLARLYDVVRRFWTARNMLNRALAILLTTTIVACPLVCHSGPATVGAAGCASRCGGCCHANSQPASPGEQSCPGRDSSRDSEGNCQCLCGGAVLENACSVGAHFDASWSFPLPELESVRPHLQSADVRPNIAHCPNGGMNPGRALCCLYNTFLC